jgi:hypothetical protein
MFDSFFDMKFSLTLLILWVTICQTSFLGEILRGNMNSTLEIIKNRKSRNVTQVGNNCTELEIEASIETPAIAPPVHRLDFLTLIIPFFCLFSVSVVILLVNLFKTSFSSSSSSVPGNRYTPDINIIEPTRSVAAREVISEHDEEVGYLTAVVNKK